MRARFLAAVVAAVVPAAPALAADKPATGRAVWTPADKDGFGTSATRGSHVWFTLRRGELTEVYAPDLGTPSFRDLRIAPAGRAHHRTVLTDPQSLTYRQIDTGRGWRMTRTYVTDPRRATVLVRLHLRSRDGKRHRVDVDADPALANTTRNDVGRAGHGRLLARNRGRRLASALVAAPGLTATSTRYRRHHDLVQSAATRLTGRPGHRHMTLALSFGHTPRAALATARTSLRHGFAATARRYARGWHRYIASLNAQPAAAAPYGALYNVSAMVLAASEDKIHRGAYVAAPAMPWAFGRGLEKPSGVYHEVWSRDLYQIATALIADGDRAGAQRALNFLLERQQKRDGSFPQNSDVRGRPHWTGLQMDEVAFPIVLAEQLGRDDPATWGHVHRAADFIVRKGPGSEQERWENQEGWSPATIAAEIAGLVCAADLARARGADAKAAHYEQVADRWRAQVQSWTATSNGPYSDQPYYLRLSKGGHPNRPTTYTLGDGGPKHIDQRRVVDPSFLELVRLGVVRADDPVIRNTLSVVDRVLRVDTPRGTYWRRYTQDGYGEMRNGAPWTTTPDNSGLTLGRAWPLLAGERGEYDLLAGAPAGGALAAMANAASRTELLPEQVWDGRPPTGRGGRAAGTGTESATPLAWSHAQFIRLAWSIDAGRPVEQPAAVACRYVRACP